MRKALPVSAIITGLLALPGLGAGAAAAAETSLVAASVEAFPAVMPAAVAMHLRRLARGEKLDAFGMQDLHKHLVAEVQQHLAQHVERRERLYPAQLAAPAAAVISARKERAAFLGVATSPAPAILRDQLNLPRGAGLVVDFVDKDSPAEAAGVKVHDVLEKLEDQWLINSQQFAVLVRGKKPGDTVTLTVIHAGKRQEVKVKLVEKEVALLEDLADPTVRGGLALGTPDVPGTSGTLRFQGGLPELVPPNMAGTSFRLNSDGSSVRRQVDDQNDITVYKSAGGKETLSVKDRQGQALYEGDGDGLDKAGLPAEVVSKVKELRQGAGDIRVKMGDTPPGDAKVKVFTANRKDAQHDITLKSDGGERYLTVKDVATGKTVFYGPADTEEQMKALPVDVQEKVKTMLEKIK